MCKHNDHAWCNYSYFGSLFQWLTFFSFYKLVKSTVFSTKESHCKNAKDRCLQSYFIFCPGLHANSTFNIVNHDHWKQQRNNNIQYILDIKNHGIRFALWQRIHFSTIFYHSYYISSDKMENPDIKKWHYAHVSVFYRLHCILCQKDMNTCRSDIAQL